MKIAVAIAAAGAMAAACVEEAHIAVPSDLAAAAERLELTGMGGGTSGSFQLGGSSGRFTRSAERGSGFGLVEKSGSGSFTIGEPLVGGELSGRCRFSEGEAEAGRGISIVTDQLAYRCTFDRGGRPIDAELMLEAANDTAGAMFRYERKGMLLYEGQRIALRSVHRFQRGKLPTATPLGYAFEADGAQIGAIDLNGLDKTIYAPRDPRRREAVIAASLALSIFWDPGDSD